MILRRVRGKRARVRCSRTLLALTLGLAASACTNDKRPSEATDAAAALQATAISATEIAGTNIEGGRSVPASYAKYYSAPQVQPLIADLEFLSKGGDADASFMLSRIYDDCAVIPDAGSLAQLDIPQARKRAIERSGAWFKRHCEGMSTDVVAAIRNVKHYQALAVKQGNLAAQIEAAAPGLHRADQNLSIDDHKTFVEAVLTQEDGEAYMALAAMMGEGASLRIEQMKPYKVGTAVEEAAWMLAGCRKGVPCDAQSPMLNRLCRSGMCGYDSVEALYSNEVLAPEQMQRARERADEIIAQSRTMK